MITEIENFYGALTGNKTAVISRSENNNIYIALYDRTFQASGTGTTEEEAITDLQNNFNEKKGLIKSEIEIKLALVEAEKAKLEAQLAAINITK